MKSRINWTGRRTIPRDAFQLRIIEGAPPTFTANLEGLKSFVNVQKHGEARIYVEPYLGSSSMRFDFGTVANTSTPTDTSLSEVDAGGRILFRLRVVDEANGVGRIIASANEVAPDNEAEGEGRRPLLPVQYRDLGEEIWTLEFFPGPPLLVLNSRVPAISDRIKADPLFRGAIIPHAVERIFRAVFGEDSGGEEWVNDWKTFAAQLNDGSELEAPEDPEAVDVLVAKLLRAFNGSHAWATRYREMSTNGH